MRTTQSNVKFVRQHDTNRRHGYAVGYDVIRLYGEGGRRIGSVHRELVKRRWIYVDASGAPSRVMFETRANAAQTLVTVTLAPPVVTVALTCDACGETRTDTDDNLCARCRGMVRGARAKRNALLSAYRFFRSMGNDARGALSLARAEEYADAHGWVTTWEDDDGGEDCLGDHAYWCANQRRIDAGQSGWPCQHEVLCAVLKAPTGDVLASLGACIDVSRDYARIVAAELAQEALAEQRTTRATAVRRRWNIVPLPLALLLALILAPLVSACTLAQHETPPAIRQMPAPAIVSSPTPAPDAYAAHMARIQRNARLVQQRAARRAALRRAYAMSLLLN